MPTRLRLATALVLLAAVAAPFAAPYVLERTPPAESALWLTLATQLSWSAIAGLLALQLGGRASERLGLGRSALGVGSVALLVLGTLALSGALDFSIDALALGSGGSLERLESVVRDAAPRSPGLVLIAFGIAPAFGEELLFRGALQRSLAGRFGALGVPLAAAAFGLVHLDSVHTPAAFVLGSYLGCAAYLSRSTWPAIACHLANNCLATVPPLLGAELPHPRSWPDAAVWLAASGLCAAGVAWAQLRAPNPQIRASD